LLSIHGQVSQMEKNCRGKLVEHQQKKQAIETCIRKAIALREKLDGIKSRKFQCTDKEKSEINEQLQDFEKSLKALPKDDNKQLKIRAANAERLANVVRDQRKRCEKLEEENKRLQILLNGSGGNQDEIISQLQSELTQLPGLKKRFKELTQEHNKVLQSYNLSEARIEQVVKQRDAFETKLLQLESNFSQKSTDLDDMVQSCVKLKGKLVDATKRADLYESECTQLELESEGRIRKWKSQYEEAEKKAAAENAEALRLTELLSKRENEIHKLAARNKLVENELEKIRSEQALSRELKGIEDELPNEEHEKQINTLTNELDEAKKELHALKLYGDKSEAKYKELQSEVELMNEENATLQETIISITEKLQEVENRAKELEVTAMSATVANDHVEELRKKLNEMETSLQLEKKENEERVLKLETALSLSEEARKSKVFELEGLLVETEKENKILKGELERTTAKIENETNEAVAECESLKAEVQRLQKQLMDQKEVLEDAVRKRDNTEKLLKITEENFSEAIKDRKREKACNSIVAEIAEHTVKVIDTSETDEAARETQEEWGGAHFQIEQNDPDMMEENKEDKAHQKDGNEIYDSNVVKTVEKIMQAPEGAGSFEIERSKTAQLELTIFDLESRLKQQSSKIQELSERLENEPRKEWSPERQKLDSPKPEESDADLRSLQTEIEAQKHALSKTEVTVMTYLAQIEQLNEEIRKLKSSLVSREELVSSLKSEVESLTKSVTDRGDELATLAIVVNARETEIKELKSLLDERAKVEDEVNRTSKLLEESKNQASNLERKIQILENVKSMVFRKNKEMQDKLSAAEETLKCIAGKESEKDSNRESQLKLDLIDLKSQLELSAQSLKDKDSAMVVQKHQMEQENKSLHEQLNTFSDKVHNLSTENKKVKSEKEVIEEEVQRLREAMSSYSKTHEEELSTLANSKRDLEGKLKALSSSSTTMIKDLSNVLDGTVSVNALLTNASVDALQTMCPDLTVGERCAKSDELLDQILPNIRNGVMYKKRGTTNRQIVQLGEVISEILIDKAKLGKRVNKLYVRFFVTVDDKKTNSPVNRRKGKSFRKGR